MTQRELMVGLLGWMKTYELYSYKRIPPNSSFIESEVISFHGFIDFLKEVNAGNIELE